MALLFRDALARADHNPAHVLAFGVRSWSPLAYVLSVSKERAEDLRLELPASVSPDLFVERDTDISLTRIFPYTFELRTQDRFAEVESSLLAEEVLPAGRFGRETFEHKAFDFQRKCLNPCPLGGWGTCAVATRVAQEDCEAIAGRTLVSAAARRAPMVREILKLVGSKTTKLPTDVDRGLRLSASLFQGGGTLGIEARW
jgi:hypothetical protein